MKQEKTEESRHRRFESMTRTHEGDLFRFAFWLCRDHSVAQDLVQETLLRAWRSFDSLRDESAARYWLITILRRENARMYERKRHPTRDIDDLTPAEQGLLANTPDTDLADLREAISRLDPDYREPLILQVLMGFSTEEIAGLMEIKQGAVLTRLYRARKMLMKGFGDESKE
jgi:RNA polymerase sigma-70 factor (ECF subfamily)